MKNKFLALAYLTILFSCSNDKETEASYIQNTLKKTANF